MLMRKNRKYAGYFSALLLITSAFLFPGTLPTLAQETDSSEGEITFVRLANGEPGGEGIYIINEDGTDERPLFLFEDLGLPYDVYNGGYRCPVWSPDGQSLAFNGTDAVNTNYIAVVDVESGDVELVYNVEHDDEILRGIYYPEWVPNENQISFGFTEVERTTGILRAHGVRIVSLEDGEIQTIRDDIGLTEADGSPRYMGGPVPNYTPFAHSWSPDGSQIALASYNWRTYLMDADGENLRELSPQWVNGDVEWSPDGTLLADSLYRMILLDPTEDTEREIVPLGESLNGATVESLAWSADGSEIAYSTMWIDITSGAFTTAFSVSIVDVETGEIRELTRTPSFVAGEYPYNISCVDWRPTGETAD